MCFSIKRISGSRCFEDKIGRGKVEIFETIVILTGDSDFEVVVEALRNKGKNIIIICNKRALSRELRKASNQIIYLHQLKREIEYKKPRSLGAHTL